MAAADVLQREGTDVSMARLAETAGEHIGPILEVARQICEVHRLAAVDLVRHGIAAGTVAPCDPDALVATCRALTDGLMVQRVLTGGDLDNVHRLVCEQLFAPLEIADRKRTARR